MRKKNIILLAFLVASILNINGQVTIGSGNQPAAGALLQLKETQNVIKGEGNASKGFLLPRVILSKKDQLFPMFLVDTDNPNSGATTEYTSDKTNIDAVHTGLIVYNVKEDIDEDLCLGLNQWNGNEWACFQQKPTTSVFTVDCGSVNVYGSYGDGVALNSSNYLKVTINVTRIGAYSISAATSGDDNGYFFETTGTFHSVGTFSLIIPGTGQPINHTQGLDLVDPSDNEPDEFILTSSASSSDLDDCKFLIDVRSTAARPEFTMNCGGTVVEGMYFEDQALSAVPNDINGQSHRIKVTLQNIPASAYGSIAMLETNTVDGFSFKGEAVLISSTQDVYLEGTGIPRGLNDKVFIITSNSEASTASCSATVHMLIPRKRLMALGEVAGLDNTYGYNPATITNRNPTNSFNALLTDKNNFGYNQWSILKFAGFTNKGTGVRSNHVSNLNSWSDDNRDIVGVDVTAWRAMSAETLESFLKGTNGRTKVDIFMIAYTGAQGSTAADYFRTGNAEDQARCQKLVDFAKSGGILMICSEQATSNGNFLRLFFNNSSISSANGAGPGSNYTLGFNNSNMPPEMKPYYCKDDDPILRGPFADILGRNWGEDASTTIYTTNLPLDEIIIYSGAREIGNTARPAAGVTIFRHIEHPFVFIGDGGFNSSEARSYKNSTSNLCPFTLENKTINGRTYSNYPSFRLNFGGSGNRVYNTVFTANAFAWCIYQAEEYRRANR